MILLYRSLSSSPIKIIFRVSQAENAALQQFSHRRSVPYHVCGIVDCELINFYSVPTNDQIMVPETLLKKRKSQEKARAERSDAVEKKKAVSTTIFYTMAT